MKPNEDLFDLIKSMSVAERRHFRLNARRYSPSGAEKKYVLLFDAILAQNHYNEAQLRIDLQHEISTNSFGSWKRHLLAYVEASIREFHIGRDSAELVHELLRDAELLHRRGLWARARKKIIDARDSATRLGDLLALLKINEVERRLIIEFELKGIEGKMAGLLEESAQLLAKLANEQALAAIFEQICLLVRLQFDPRAPRVMEQIPGLLADPRLQPGQQFPSPRAERFYHQARAFAFHLSSQPLEEYQAYQDLLQFWEAYPEFRRASPKLYKLSLTNFLHVAVKLGRWSDFPMVIDKISGLPPDNKDEAAEDFQTVLFFKHLYALNRYELQNALALIPAIEAGLIEFQEKVNHARWLSFRINIAVNYFMLGQAAQARKQLELILSHPKSDQRTDAQALARLLEPIVIIDLGDTELAAQKLHALKEWLRTHKRFFEFERIVISNLEAMIASLDTDRPRAFQALANSLQRLQILQGNLQGLEMILHWANSKVEQKP